MPNVWPLSQEWFFPPYPFLWAMNGECHWFLIQPISLAFYLILKKLLHQHWALFCLRKQGISVLTSNYAFQITWLQIQSRMYELKCLLFKKFGYWFSSLLCTVGNCNQEGKIDGLQMLPTFELFVQIEKEGLLYNWIER